MPQQAFAQLSPQEETHLWAKANLLAEQLREEKKKWSVLAEELERLKFMGEDYRDLQLIPSQITLLSKDEEVQLDKRIEQVEKRHADYRNQLHDLEIPLNDGILVAREMLEGNPNTDMMELISHDHLARVEKLIRIQKELNQFWDEAIELLAPLQIKIGINPERQQEEEYIKVLMSNIGRASLRFYQSFNNYKDGLAKRGTTNDWEKMARIDLGRLQKRLGSRNAELVQQGLQRLCLRFTGKITMGSGYYLLGNSYLAHAQYEKAARSYARVENTSRSYAQSRLGYLQSLFGAHMDDSLVLAYGQFLQEKVFDQKMFPSAHYLATQSYYALGLDSALESEMLHDATKDINHYKSLFIYAKSLVRLHKNKEARAVLGDLNAQAQLPHTFHNQIQITLAHLSYEEKLYDLALKGYQSLLDQNGFQAEALYGMIWSNIRLGDMDAAEFILKKLIAQYPNNPWAIGGFNVLARKLALNAENAWSLSLSLEKDKAQLQTYRKKLQNRIADHALTDVEAKKLTERLNQAESALLQQHKVPIEDISRMYEQALGLCDFVESRYQTGEYTDRTYQRDRENVLQKLTALTNESSPSNAAIEDTSSSGSLAMRLKIFENKSLALDIRVQRRAWLESWLKYTQRKLNEEINAQPNDSIGTAKQAYLRKQTLTLADQISERLAAYSEDLLNRLHPLMEDPASYSIRDWLLFQNGLLNYEQAENTLKKQWAATQWLDAQGINKEAQSTIDFMSYEKPWEELLEKNPHSAYAAATLYFLGFSQTARGEATKGIHSFEMLAQSFPKSYYTQQALVFIGEYFFRENNLIRAEEAFDKVLDFPDSKYFEQALYKLAWTRFRSSSYKTAISSFTYILEESSTKGKMEGKTEKKSQLTQEALQFAALSIAEGDTSGDGGLGATQVFAKKLGDGKLGAKLTHRMAVIYAQQGRLERAKKALETLFKDYPDYENLPQAMMEMSQAFDKEQNYAKAIEVREALFRQYHKGSPWYEKQTVLAIKAQADTVNQLATERVANSYLYEATQNKKNTVEQQKKYLRKAINTYENFLQVYPNHPQRAKYIYQEAEAYYGLDDFAEASKQYMRVSRIGDAKLKMTAAYNAIAAAQELLKKLEEEKK